MTKPTQPTIKEQLEELKNTPSKPIAVSKDSQKATEPVKAPPIPIGDKKDPKLGLSVTSEKLSKADIARENGKNGGRPPKEETLVMRGIREYMAQHANEEIDITVTDPKTGKSRVVKKPRSIILLEILFTEAFQKKNIAAIKEWLDRAVGKPAQPIRGDGDSDAPIRMEHDISSIIAKAYGDDADNGED